MKISETRLPGVLLIEPDIFGDHRGFFLETWNKRRYQEAGLDRDFVQDNLSLSRHGILRGLHYQWPQPQGKLVQVLRGAVFDVAVDIRQGSPTFGQWVGYELTAENHLQLFIPEGFAHGFCVISDQALFSYKCTDLYNPATEHGLLWNDPDIQIDWPVSEPLLSEKDSAALALRDIPRPDLPTFPS